MQVLRIETADKGMFQIGYGDAGASNEITNKLLDAVRVVFLSGAKANLCVDKSTSPFRIRGVEVVSDYYY